MIAATAVDTHCPYCTHCPNCALQCGMRREVEPAGGVTVRGRSFPGDRGGPCQKGWTSAEPVSWDVAFTLVVDRVRAVQAESGRDAVAEQDLCDAFAAGCPRPGAVATATRDTTSCGSCVDKVCSILDRLREEQLVRSL